MGLDLLCRHAIQSERLLGTQPQLKLSLGISQLGARRSILQYQLRIGQSEPARFLLKINLADWARFSRQSN